MTWLRAIVSLLLLLGAFAFIATRTDWPSIAAVYSNLSWLAIAFSIFAMVAGALLASWRLQMIAGDLGYRLGFLDAVSALSFGQILGTLFFQLAGQLMARSAVLSRRRIPVSGTSSSQAMSAS